MQEHEGLSFREAVEVLAERYDVPLTADFGRGGGGGGAASKADDERSRALLAHQLAAEFYSSRLRTADAAPCATLLRGRYGARASALANRFGLGYAPGGAGAAELTEHLRAAGLTDDELVAAGLSRPRYGQKGGPIVDRFAGRLMIPIWDRKGEVVAFGARILDGAAAASAGSFEEAKYINSAESLVFKKRETLYGAHLARDAARAAGEVVVVEGYLDAIALHAAGVANAVACLGTALTQTQLLAAAALSPAGRVVLNLDGDDEAGANAVSRLASQDVLTAAAAAGADVRVATMPEGLKDPDEALRAMGVDEYVAGVIKPAVGWVEWLAAKELAAYEASGADSRLRRCAALQGLVAKAPTAAARAHHARRLARALAEASGGADAAFAARVEAELLAPAPRRPPPPSRPGAAPADAPAAPQEADGPASALVAAAGGAVPLSDLFVWTSAGGGGAAAGAPLDELDVRPAAVAAGDPRRALRAAAVPDLRAGSAPAARRRPPPRPRAPARAVRRAGRRRPRARRAPPPPRAAQRAAAPLPRRPAPPPATRRGGRRRRGGDQGRARGRRGRHRRRRPREARARDAGAAVAAAAARGGRGGRGAGGRAVGVVARARIGGAGDVVRAAELRAPSDALLADASAWAADPRAARRDAEIDILEREMRGGNAWASRDADAAAPEPAEAGAGAVDEAAARADGMRLLRRSTAAIVRDEHRQRLVGVQEGARLAASAPRCRSTARRCPRLAEDCSAIADELEAEAEELRQVADAVEESEMEATDEKARVTPDGV